MKNLTSIKDKSLNSLSSFKIENLSSVKGGGTLTGGGTQSGAAGTVAWDSDGISSGGNLNYNNLRWVCKN